MHIDLVFILMLALSMTYWAYPDAHNFGAAPIFCLKNALVQNKCIIVMTFVEFHSEAGEIK